MNVPTRTKVLESIHTKGRKEYLYFLINSIYYIFDYQYIMQAKVYDRVFDLQVCSYNKLYIYGQLSPLLLLVE